MVNKGYINQIPPQNYHARFSVFYMILKNNMSQNWSYFRLIHPLPLRISVK